VWIVLGEQARQLGIEAPGESDGEIEPDGASGAPVKVDEKMP
jgi:hypothetical protein